MLIHLDLRDTTSMKLLPAGPCNKVMNTSQITCKLINEHTQTKDVTLLPGETNRWKRKRNYAHTFHITNLSTYSEIDNAFTWFSRRGTPIRVSALRICCWLQSGRFTLYSYKSYTENLQPNVLTESYNTFVNVLYSYTTWPFANHVGSRRTTNHSFPTCDHADQHK